MASGKEKLIVAILLILGAIILDETSANSPIQLGQLLLSFALAIAGALIGIRGLLEFLSEKF